MAGGELAVTVSDRSVRPGILLLLCHILLCTLNLSGDCAYKNRFAHLVSDLPILYLDSSLYLRLAASCPRQRVVRIS
ncbi:hypothetical protein M011DRAFT_313211 [Sporormia fimetaria CBS 119925]|uniref:Uncharacterized protein n=1 Tax=Sporormia fimetaria CBS 119925 TaxID=1340428 RepID=A0A6A6VIG2_9PLEO|nr:hypothetical protein M011DRAFT_313211 [Sporormia fimetaria CBS 119925]